MRFPVLVQNDDFDSSYGEGRRRVSQKSLILSDNSPVPSERMATMIEVQLTELQAVEYVGKCVGKVLELVVNEPAAQMFGGRFRPSKFQLSPVNGTKTVAK